MFKSIQIYFLSKFRMFFKNVMFSFKNFIILIAFIFVGIYESRI